jgi:hypothetical protein
MINYFFFCVILLWVFGGIVARFFYSTVNFYHKMVLEVHIYSDLIHFLKIKILHGYLT